MEPLELKIFDSNVAGEEFFDRLAKLRKRFDQSRDPGERDTILGAIEVFFTCLECGFKGRFRGAEGELSAVRRGLLTLLWPDAEGRQHRPLWPEAYGDAGQIERRRRKMNLWPLIVVGCILLCVGLWFAYQVFLGGKARDMEEVVRDRVQDSVHDVGKEER
jgi:type IV/VI secretion system ImpK/VasF family protein